MFISVVIPAHRGNDLLNKCIKNIRESLYGDYEIIVIDDFSKPPLTIEDPDVRLIVGKSKIGPAASRNLGASQAAGDIILFVDADVMLSKNAYCQILRTFDTSDYDAVHGIYSLNFPYKDLCSKYKNLYWNFNQMHLDPNGYSICTAIFAIRKNVFDEIGGFNSVSLIGEDKEIGLKLKEKNKKVFQNKDAQGTHYRKFNFARLLKHHLENSIACTVLILKNRGRYPVKHGTAWVEKKQVIGMLLSAIIVSLTLLAFFTFSSVFFVPAVVALLIFFCFAADFLRFSYKRFGLGFSIFAFLMYLLEEIIAIIGICLGILRFFLFKRKDLHFKIEVKP